MVDPTVPRWATVPAVELVTVGQRRGLRIAAATRAARRVRTPSLTALVARTGAATSSRSTPAATVTVGPLAALWSTEIADRQRSLGRRPAGAVELLEVQISAHGRPVPARWSGGGPTVVTASPVRRVAPGQSVVLYRRRCRRRRRHRALGSTGRDRTHPAV